MRATTSGRHRRRAAVAAGAVAAWLLLGAACGQDDPTLDLDGTPTGAAADDRGPGQAAPGPDGGLTVNEALAGTVEGPVTVRGFLIDADGETRLCEAVLESYPPQCGQPSLVVEGVDVATVDGAQQHEHVTWAETVSLTGELHSGVLRVTSTNA